MSALLRVASALILTLGYAAHAVEHTDGDASYQITGIVISSVDESPVPHAHLNASPTSFERSGNHRYSRAGRSAAAIGTDADEHGRFVLIVPSDGRWHLTASNNGFVSQDYDEHDAFSSAVVLTPAQKTIDLRFHISPEAEISGTVSDEAGEPVRDARVVLQHRPAASPDQEQEEFRNRMVVQTDDRGVFEFIGLAEGDYRVMVDARPWYSTATQPQRPTGSAAPVDPTLDVTYQLTWFPGVDNSAEAEILSVHPGDNQRADFHLVPIPAAHMQIATPAATGLAGRRSPPVLPLLERVDTGGTGLGGASSRIGGFGSSGQFDIGGLAPGLYRLRIPGPDQSQPTRLIEIAPGSSRVLDASTSATQMAEIVIESTSASEEQLRGVVLRNMETGARFTPWRADMFFRAQANRDGQSKASDETTLQVPPGRYEVRLPNPDLYLVGIVAKGAEVSGRFLTVHAGDVKLKLLTAKGRAAVDGFVVANGKPVEGAMVILVPAGLEDPRSFASVVRDQSNTDGSFELKDVIPGQYILIAVDHGWQVNWKDAATLERYLTQGVPLDLRTDARVKQEVPAQQP